MGIQEPQGTQETRESPQTDTLEVLRPFGKPGLPATSETWPDELEVGIMVRMGDLRAVNKALGLPMVKLRETESTKELGRYIVLAQKEQSRQYIYDQDAPRWLVLGWALILGGTVIGYWVYTDSALTDKLVNLVGTFWLWLLVFGVARIWAGHREGRK